jgi:uncharacterized integral membrane protein
MIYLTATVLPPGVSSTVHIYTQTIHRTTQITASFGGVRALPRLCEFYPQAALQLSKKHGKTSVSVAEEPQS